MTSLGPVSVGTQLTDGEPTLAVGAPPSVDEDRLPRGTTVGRYVLLETIGRGGIGTVARAYDPKLGREVALKYLRSRALDNDAGVRLTREAQAMAKLSHPGVVAVYDVDKIGEEVVVAMELVPGTTLRRWLAEAKPSVRTILDVFVRAGRGLAAAHAAGIVHRDFKPSNVLVDPGADGRLALDRGIVKVADFGLAKGAWAVNDPEPDESATTHRSTDSSTTGTLTEMGAVIGTPRYMAPEQYGGTDIDARADQYAFCVALWEALTGKAPFRGDRTTVALAKDDGPPAWPGVRGVPERIARALRRGLAPKREDRWPSMNDLLAVLAARRSRRLRWVAGGAAVAAIAGAAGVIAQRATALCTGASDELADVWNDGRRTAVKQALHGVEASYVDELLPRVESSVDRFAQDWIAQHTEACEATSVRGEQSEAVLDRRMACLRRARTDLDAAIDVLEAADARVVEHALDVVSDLPSPLQCAEIDRLRDDEVPAELREAADAIGEQLAAARRRFRAGTYAEALEVAGEAHERAVDLGFEPLLAEATYVYGRALDLAGRRAEAEEHLSRALKDALRLGERATAQHAASSLARLLGTDLRRPDEGRHLAEIGLSLAQGRDPGGLEEAKALFALASVLRADDDPSAAEVHHRAAFEIRLEHLGPDHPQVAESRGAIANALWAQGRNAEAREGHLEGLEVLRRAYGPEHPTVATAHNNLSGALWAAGDHAAAREHVERAVELREKALGPDHLTVAESKRNLAIVLYALEEFEEARALLQALLDRQLEILPEHSHEIASTRATLAPILRRLDRLDEAEAMLRELIATREATHGADSKEAMSDRHNLGNVLEDLDRPEEAQAEYRRAITAGEASLGPDHQRVASAHLALGQSLLGQDQPEDALPPLEHAWAARSSAEVSPEDTARAAFALARALRAAGRDPQRARDLAERALTLYADAKPPRSDEVAAVKAWLEE